MEEYYKISANRDESQDARQNVAHDAGDNDCGTANIVTFGCRLNTYEAEIIRRHAANAGLRADTLIVNTCAVTAEAVRQAAQAIRRHRRKAPHAKIVVTGCAAQIEPQRFADMPEVDHIVGNAEKLQAATFLALAKAETARVQVNDIMSIEETAGHLIDGFATRTRAYMQIQNGCDRRCTFCIIPYGRGPSRSVPAGEAVQRIRQLVEAGHREVVLTGVDIASYGRDLPGSPSLGRLVRQILRHVPELPRLRLSSIDHVEADPALLACLADEPRLMPHLHLSLQAGHDLTLKRMKRRHLRADAIDFCREARRLRPDIVFGADLIAGFPTETEDMFAATLDIVDACDLTFLHVFPFSARPGTPAARMPQVDRQTVKERAARLRRKADAKRVAFLASQQGKELEAMVEFGNLGRTPQFAEVEITSRASGLNPGTIVRMKITGHDERRLLAEPAL